LLEEKEERLPRGDCLTDRPFSCGRARSNPPRAPAVDRTQAYTGATDGACKPPQTPDRGRQLQGLVRQHPDPPRSPMPTPRPTRQETGNRMGFGDARAKFGAVFEPRKCSRNVTEPGRKTRKPRPRGAAPHGTRSLEAGFASRKSKTIVGRKERETFSW